MSAMPACPETPNLSWAYSVHWQCDKCSDIQINSFPRAFLLTCPQMWFFLWPPSLDLHKCK